MSDESGGILGKNRDKAGGSSSAVLLGSITTNGPSLRLASSFSTGDGSDRAGGLEEAPRCSSVEQIFYLRGFYPFSPIHIADSDDLTCR